MKKKVILSKLILTSISMVLLIVSLLLFQIFEDSTDILVIILRHFVFVSLTLFLFYKNFTYFRMLTNEEYYSAREIERTDERNILINMKSSSITLKTIFYFLCVGVLVSSFYSVVVFYTQLIILVVFSVIFATIRLYYQKTH